MPFHLFAGLASLPVFSEALGRLHEAWRFRRDDRVSLPAPPPLRVERIPAGVAESPKEDHLDRLLDANPLADGKEHLPDAEVRRDVK